MTNVFFHCKPFYMNEAAEISKAETLHNYVNAMRSIAEDIEIDK
jgi:hypothetical protein